MLNYRTPEERVLGWGLLVGGALVAFFLFVAIVSFNGGLMPEYSDGDRLGVVFKFSHKGFVWRSWEGELLLNDFVLRKPGEENGSNIFQFSVESDEIAQQVKALEGKRVKLHYRQYLLAPMRIGTAYVITAVTPLDGPLEKKTLP